MKEDRDSVRDTEAPTADSPSRGAADPLIGFVINEVYEIRERIDAGGMGVVYLAWDRGLHRFVAVKTLRARALVGSDGVSIEEAARQARIDHPAFVAVMHASTFEHPDGDRCAFFVMEYVKGARSLLAHARAKSLSTEKRLELFESVCEAVRHLHEREGLIHFDLKNANVLVDDRGRVRVIDLGVARALRDHEADVPGGTITCMSPEHIRGRAADLDHRCDVWSLGVMLYMLLADGRAPFTARGEGEGPDCAASLRRAICEDDPAPLEVEAGLWRIIDRALAKLPSDRYGSVGAMLDDLRALRGESPERDDRHEALATGGFVLRRRVGMVAVAGVIALVSVLIAIPLTPMVVSEWTGLQPAFGRWLLAPASVGGAAPLSQTAIIAFGDATDAEAIAEEIGVEGVLNHRVVSHRLLHGELSRRLAASGADAVVFDIVFRSETEYDESFAAGIRALRRAGIGVVIATPRWVMDDATGQPILSDRLWAEDVGWGCFALNEVGGQLAVPLVVRRGDAVMPSLPMAAFAAGRAYGGEYSLTLDEDRAEVEVRYWKVAESGERRPGAPADRIALTSVESFDPTQPRVGPSMGYREEDRIGVYFAATLERAAMEAVTHAYEDVFRADETELRQWFSDRVVLIGNASQAGRDLHPVGDEIWPGVYLQAAATESLLRRHRTRAPWDAVVYGVAGSGALIGALATIVIAGPRLRNPARDAAWRGVVWIGVSALGAGALALASVLTFRSLAMFWSPFFPAIATSIAAAGGVIVASAFASRSPSRTFSHQGDWI